MHERLVGEEVALELPCNGEASTLLMEFIEELLEVGGADVRDPDDVRRELADAVAILCGAPSAAGPEPGCEGRLQARLTIRADAVDVRLAHSDTDRGERTLTVHEA